MDTTVLFPIVILASAQPSPATDEIPTSVENRTRAEFVEAMRQVERGMTGEQVKALLGEPDDLVRLRELGNIYSREVSSIWCYGTNGHLTFPTLGHVCMSDADIVSDMVGGGGQPPDPTVVPEEDLRTLLRLVDSAVRNRNEFNPRLYIAVVNSLQPLGKDRALAVIEEFVRLTPERSAFAEHFGVFLILRLLFEIPADPGFMPPMLIGAPMVAEPADPTLLPLFPLVVVDDVPLLINSGYSLNGGRQPVRDHISYFRTEGIVRQSPPHPPDKPLRVLGKLEASPQWLLGVDYATKFERRGVTPGDDHHAHVHDEMERVQGREQILQQLLLLVDTVYRDPPKELSDYCAVDLRAKRVEATVERVSLLDIRWDIERSRYCFADGSTLPPIVSVHYIPEKWELDLPHVHCQIDVIRQDEQKVEVDVAWVFKAGSAMEPVTIRVLPTDQSDLALHEFRFDPASESVRIPSLQRDEDGSYHTGDTGFGRHEGQVVALAAGSGLFIEIRYKDQIHRSPRWIP